MLLVHIACKLRINGSHSLRIRHFKRYASLEQVHILREKSLWICLIQRPKHLIQICSGDRVSKRNPRQGIARFDQYATHPCTFVGARQHQKTRLNLR